jgi:hypothetical protein
LNLLLCTRCRLQTAIIMAERDNSSLHSSGLHWVDALNQASVDMDAAAANIQSTFFHARTRQSQQVRVRLKGTKRCECRWTLSNNLFEWHVLLLLSDQ